MDQPNNIFAFESELTLHIFVAVGAFDVNEFTDFIDKASHKKVPDKVMIYYLESSIKPPDLERVKKKVNRRFHCDLACYSFNSEGQFGQNEKKVAGFLEEGTKEIIRLREPVVYPPPGRSFVKPSGSRKSFFIQAANLFVRHAEMSFFALLLIRKWGKLFDEKIKTVYVDTIDLYGLISVAGRMRFGRRSHGPITVSYSSYSSYKEVLKNANVSTSLMVISATTSHRLLRKILHDTKWKSVERVVTILDLDSTLCDLELVDNHKVIAPVTPKGLQTHARLMPSIRLSGEKFTLEVDEPKSVVLNVTSHASCLRRLKLESLKEMVDCLSVYAKCGKDRLPIYVDQAKLLKNKKFREWLRQEIENFAPASTGHVVCVGDCAEEIKPLFNEVFGERMPEFISPKEIQKENLKIKKSIIVIYPTFTTGTKLLEVSRDLRKHKHHKNIVYITGIGTPVSSAEFKKLKDNLEQGHYQVRSFCNVCTGQPTSLSLSWESEHDLLREGNALGSFKELDARRKVLEDGKLTDDELFYQVDELEFHPGFRYWEKLVAPYPSVRPSVLLFITFAFLLQNARTDESLPDKDRLISLPNRRALLSPENFFRYNDSLLQIVILRAAFPGEIDYSDHEAHSASIFYLIQRAEQLGQRAVVYEFLLALATRRLCLTAEKLKEVRVLINSSEMRECAWFKNVEIFKVTGA